MPRLHHLLVLTVLPARLLADPAPVHRLPYVNTFQVSSHPALEPHMPFPGWRGWRVPRGITSVQPFAGPGETQAVVLEPGSVIRHRVIPDGEDIVWVETMVRCTGGAASVDSLPARPNAAAVLFDATEGMVAIDGDGAGGGTLVECGVPSDGRWRWVAIRHDFGAQQYSVMVDGATVASGLGFVDAVAEIHGFDFGAGESRAALSHLAIGTAPTRTFPSVRGDVRIDGLLNASDLVTLINHLGGEPLSPAQQENADVDLSGSIQPADVDALAELILSSAASAEASPAAAPLAPAAEWPNALGWRIEPARVHMTGGALHLSPDPVWTLESFATEQQPITTASPWRFFRGTTEPSPEWQSLAFDDSSWESGLLPLGVGAGSPETVLADMPGGYSTVYLRRAFNVPDRLAVTQLALIADHSDGFIAYLNGVEIARRNAAGSPDHTGTATAVRAAGRAELVPLNDFVANLVTGTNVLAVQLLNNDLADPDALFNAVLETAARPRYGLITQVSPELTLGGAVPQPEAVTVQIADQTVPIDPVTRAWSATVTSTQGINTQAAVARSASGEPIDRITLRWVWAPTTINYSGFLPNNQTVTPAGPVVRIVGDTVIHPTTTLVLPPGTVVAFDPNAIISAQGRLLAQGTEDNPVLFMPAIPGAVWVGITFPTNGQGSVFDHIEVVSGGWDASARLTLPGTFSARSPITIRDSVFRFTISQSVVIWNTTTEVRDSHFHNCPEPVQVQSVLGSLEANVVTEVSGFYHPKDGLDVNTSVAFPIIVRDNYILGTQDDGIDLSIGPGTVAGNTIMNVYDKAISTERGSFSILNNVILNAGMGIGIKDSSFNPTSHNTIIAAGDALALYENVPNQGHGRATCTGLLIWDWLRTSITFQPESLITVTHSDVEGGSPVAGAGNFDADPLLWDPASGHIAPRPGSPLIGAGLGGSTAGALDAETALFDGIVTF